MDNVQAARPIGGQSLEFIRVETAAKHRLASERYLSRNDQLRKTIHTRSITCFQWSQKPRHHLRTEIVRQLIHFFVRSLHKAFIFDSVSDCLLIKLFPRGAPGIVCRLVFTISCHMDPKFACWGNELLVESGKYLSEP